MPSRRRYFRRRRLPLYVYAFVSFVLMIMGCVFSGFAMFERRSVISKVWLAGPTTIAVGLVLCGKVIIDCRPGNGSEDDEDEENQLTPLCNSTTDIQKLANDVKLQKIRNSLIDIVSTNLSSIKNPTRCLEYNCPQYESIVWNMREESCKELSTQEQAMCLETATNSNVNTCDDDNVDYYCPYCDKVEKSPAASSSKKSISNDKMSKSKSANSTPVRLKLSSKLKKSIYDQSFSISAANSPLYQGEVFLFNDRQYLI